MVMIPAQPDTTIRAIDRLHEQMQDYGWREHLGASIIGDPCLRKLWYEFRWGTRKVFNGRMLRLFRRGHEEEETFIKDLRAMGIEVWEIDPGSGKQWRFFFLNGHIGGSSDSVILGLLEAPKTVHIGEFKTHNDKSFKELIKKGVAESKPVHYAQMQFNMHGSDQFGGGRIDRAYYMAVNKNDDDRYQERVKYDPKEGERLLERGTQVVFAKEPLQRLSERPDWFECNMCDHQSICHHKRVPEVNCRTCAHSTPDPDGHWYCEAHNNTQLDKAAQIKACDYHLFIPALIPYAVMVEADTAALPQWVKYKHEDGTEFYNATANNPPPIHTNAYTSKELHHLDPSMIGDPVFNDLRMHYDGEVVGGAGSAPLPLVTSTSTATTTEGAKAWDAY